MRHLMLSKKTHLESFRQTFKLVRCQNTPNMLNTVPQWCIEVLQRGYYRAMGSQKRQNRRN